MKILIQHKAKPHTGKGQFIDRLIPALKALGHEITGDITEKSDIALHVGRVHYKSKALRNIIRVGPACIDTNKNPKQTNADKWKSVKQCDGVIYQSEYSRKIYHKLVGKTKSPESVIYNGASPEYYKLFGQHESPYETNFLCSTRKWIPQKRLKYIIKAFNEAAVKNSRLWIAGDYSMTKWAKQTVLPGNIKFLGLCGQERLARLYNLCNVMVHLTHIDACPNSVVEALCAGCPVICTNEGGTLELVSQDESGYSAILDVDEPYNYKPFDLNKPPAIDVHELALQFALYSNAKVRACAPKLDINVVAKQYVEFFEKCLN